MTEKTVREIKFEKGNTFTAQFIIKFKKDWARETRRLKRSGADLSAIPIVKG